MSEYMSTIPLEAPDHFCDRHLGPAFDLSFLLGTVSFFSQIMSDSDDSQYSDEVMVHLSGSFLL